MVQVRRDGQARPLAVGLAGQASSRAGRQRMKAATLARATAVLARFGWLTRPGAGSEKPAVIPSIQPSTAGVYEMCRKRLASGGVRSQPSAARPGGVAAAPTWTAAG